MDVNRFSQIRSRSCMDGCRMPVTQMMPIETIDSAWIWQQDTIQTKACWLMVYICRRQVLPRLPSSVARHFPSVPSFMQNTGQTNCNSKKEPARLQPRRRLSANPTPTNKLTATNESQHAVWASALACTTVNSLCLNFQTVL